MATLAELMVKVGADISSFTKSMKKVQESTQDAGSQITKSMGEASKTVNDSTGSMVSSLKGIAGAVAGAFAVDKIIDFTKTILNTTAETQALQSQYEQVMGGMKSKTDQYLNDMSKKWNKHPNELKGAMTQYMAILKSKGVGEQDAYKISQDMLARTVDANAFANEDMQATIDRFVAGAKGEYDSLDTAMVNLNATMLDTKAQEKYGKKFAELSVTQQEQLKVQEMLRQHTSAGVFGQGTREADSYNNNLAMVKNTWSELLAKMGSPILAVANNGLKGIVGWLKNVDTKKVSEGFKAVGTFLGNVFIPLFDIAKTAIQKVWDKLNESGAISTAKDILGQIGDALMKIDFKKVYEDIGNFLDTWSPLIVGITGGIVAFNLITGAIALWTTITGIATVVGGAFGAVIAFITSPIGIAVIAIGALIAIAILLWKNWDTVTKWLGKAWNWVATTATKVWNGIADFFKKWGLTILLLITAPVVLLVMYLAKHWDSIKNTVSKVWNSILDTLKNTWSTITTNVTNSVSNIVGKVVEFKDKIVGKFIEIKDAVVQKVKDMATTMKDKFVAGIVNLVNEAKNIPQKIGDGILGAVDKVKDGVKSLGTKIIDIFKSTLGIHSPSKVFTKLGGYVIAGLKNGLTSENIKAFATNTFSKLTDGAMNAWSDLKGMFSGNSLSGIKSMFSSMGGNIKDLFNGTSGAVGKGVNQWKGLASQALLMTGQFTQRNLEKLLMQMSTESGGNARAINLWDSNAKKGIPSKGLMQVIDPTFKQYAMKGHNSNIYDPLSNMLASIRYAVARYGSLENAYKGVGYATGGILKGTGEGSLVRMAENGRSEAIVPLQHKRYMAPFAQAIADQMPTQDQRKSNDSAEYSFTIPVTLDGREVARATAKFTKEELEKIENKKNRMGGII